MKSVGSIFSDKVSNKEPKRSLRKWLKKEGKKNLSKAKGK